MSWVRDLFAALRLWREGVAVYQRVDVNFSGNVTVADNPGRQRTDITIGQNPDADLVGSSLTVTGDSDVVFGAGLELDGDIIDGPLLWRWQRTPTTGPASAAILVVPIADNSINTLDIRIVAISPTTGSTGGYWSFVSGTARVTSGTPTIALNGTGGHSMGLPPAVTTAWAAGALTFTAHGPTDTITALATDGGSGTLVTCASGDITAEIAGRSITISGVAGAASGTNGVHVVSAYVSATQFKIPSPAYTGYTSGGTAVLTAPPVMTWTPAVLPRLTTA